MAYTLPKNYDEISDEKGSNIRIIGAHELTIVSITEYKTKEGEESLKVDFDTADGLFSNKYYSSGRKWPNEGTKYLSFKEENLNYFKAFVKDLETSNDVKLNLTGGEEIDYTQFEGLKIGGNFILEEYKKNGQLRIGSTLSEFVGLDALSEERSDTIKLLDGTFIDYDEYLNRQ